MVSVAAYLLFGGFGMKREGRREKEEEGKCSLVFY